MSGFDSILNEAAGFGLSSHMDIDELRRLYYGRPDIYVNFTNDVSVEVEHSNLPESIVCYDVRDVVGRKVQSNTFYAHVFRINKSGKRFIDDVRRYSKTDFRDDMNSIRDLGIVPQEDLQAMINRAKANSYIRFEFERLWEVTRWIALGISRQAWRSVWREVLMGIGYGGFSNPSRTPMLGGRDIRTVYIDYTRRTDLDILPIQKYRTDPRRRVSSDVERYRMRIQGNRRRVAKRRT